MALFVTNLLLALIWSFLIGDVSVATLAFGFLVGYVALAALARTMPGRPVYFRKSRQFAGFLLFFIRELLLSTLRVAHDVVTPTHHTRPGIVAIPLRARSNLEITLLANLISLTPGTLSLDVSPDRQTLYIHAMYVDDPEALRREIKEGLESRLLELVRP